jgi:putative transposase
MCIEISLKYVFLVVVFLKGKSSIAVDRLNGWERNCTGAHFWVRGYAVSAIDFSEEIVIIKINTVKGE